MLTRTSRLGLIAVMAVLPSMGAAQTDLAQGFERPPAQARPQTWWHWMNGNVTREGIVADLEAMKHIGLGGAQIFNVSESIPAGPVLYNSPEWRELVKYAAGEAKRLGLVLCFHNCAGWSSSGGPWITPDKAMQKLVTSETAVRGPTHFSAALPQPETVAGYYRDIAVLAFPTPAADSRIKDLSPKAGFGYRYNQQPALDAFPANAVIPPDRILDLTSKLGAEGRLDWDAPAGAWTVLRIGFTPTGAKNAPSPDSGRGLECDKLSRSGLDAHWAGGIQPLLEQLGPLAGATLNNCLIDSYEVGGQNWTADFREQFKRKRGYDLLPFLPVITGRIVESGEVSERFLWDFRRTIADLFAENYYGYFAELCHKHGLMASIEPYDGPFECLLSGRDADIPMGEFWVGGGESGSCKLAASVGHTYGHPIIGAESFTAEPRTGRWQNDPASLKAVGDLMYTVGINRYIIHRYAHQPWLDKFPGMTMGQWGTHFERTTTWWKQGSAWVQYLARCQFLLQQGLFVADVCQFAGEAAPNDAPFDLGLKAAGYDSDACNTDVLLNRMEVKDSQLVLPDGMRYRLLVLPDTPFMTPETLARLRDLVQQGATIVGPRPTRSPSLSGFPGCDAEVSRLAAELWGDADGVSVKEHSLGRGRVICGKTAGEVLASAGVQPDCAFANASGKVSWIHRSVDGSSFYFLSNQMPRSQEVACTFRVAGMRPELWHPDTGVMEPAPIWSERDGRITVPIRFDPSGSVFVLFRGRATAADHVVAVTPPPMPAPPRAPAIEVISARYEATDGAGGADVTAKVAALVQSGQTSIPASNSTFGDPAYNHVKRLRVEFRSDGKPLTRFADENETLELAGLAGPDLPPGSLVTLNQKGDIELSAFRQGLYEFRTASGETHKAEIQGVRPPIEIAGPWSLRFPPNWGAPATVRLDSLISWTDHADPGVRYFSGTAEYEKEFEIPADLAASGTALYLDLGRVRNIAEVTLNGTDLGIWWKPPFAADVTGIARPGKNSLQVRITNLWVNRLIGDEQLPDDCEWNGKPLKRWPQWLVDGTPRPVRDRLTFTTWKHYTRDSIPLESGLLGPVTLRPAARTTIAVGSPD